VSRYLEMETVYIGQKRQFSNKGQRKEPDTPHWRRSSVPRDGSL